ncbi:hypothetical protein QZH41_003612 [Actinostola sp. cb2023]|nr:hypothetical protein QZH41_003612 [Actinostola sp. cb2023]
MLNGNQVFLWQHVQVFREKSGEFAKNRDILRLHLPPHIRQILQTSQGDQFNVLSVGSGDGAIDLEVLQIVEEELQRDAKYRDMKIFNRAVEPNRHHISLYKKAIENLQNNTSFDLRTQTLDQYTQELSSKEEPTTKFDLVHFNYSIYHVNIEQALKHCLDKEVPENGKVVVVVEGQDLSTFVYRLQSQQVLPELEKPEKSLADEVINIVVKNGWKYEMFTQEYEIDVTEVFDEDSIKGNLLLDFLTGSVTKSFRDTAERAHIEKVLSAMRDQTTVRDGKRLGKKIDVVLIISK